MSGEDVLGLIPARGGSRRLPGKNLAEVRGRSLLQRAIDVGLAATCIDRLIVSTDDEAIAQAARKGGAEVPFMRPKDLASDTASSLDVALNALAWADAAEPGRYGFLVLLQPTSPFRKVVDVEAALNLCRERAVSSVVTAAPADKAELLLFHLARDRIARVSETGPVLTLNGAVYVVRTDALRAGRGFINPDTLAHTMPPERSLDVDTVEDLAQARVRKPS